MSPDTIAPSALAAVASQGVPSQAVPTQAVPTRAAGFTPATLPGSTANGRAADADARARAAGYAAGWVAGARAAAEAAEQQQHAIAEQNDRAQAQRDRALTDALTVLERTVTAAAARTVPVLADARRAVHEAALDLAAAVLRRELTPGPDSARALLDRALAVPADIGLHTVRLNPADLDQVRRLLDDGAATLPAGIELVADPRLAPGDAISEHPTGYLDAQVGAALDRARRALLEDEVDLHPDDSVLDGLDGTSGFGGAGGLG